MKNEQSYSSKVEIVTVDHSYAQQRIDNFLMARLKGVPRSRIYRMVRTGEVRVNRGRIRASYKLCLGDMIRIPPVRMEQRIDTAPSIAITKQLKQLIIYEDAWLLVVNKPSGMAVHGGSGLRGGVIEGLRHLRPEAHFLELVHRLDKDTSGCLLIAKKRSALRKLHAQFRDNSVEKTYLALLAGQLEQESVSVDAKLQKNIRQGGERMVKVERSGKQARTVFRVLTAYRNSTLVEAVPVTGRTHQIRVHAAHIESPVLGDERYGNDGANREMRANGLRRLFLHAVKLELEHPDLAKRLVINAPLGDHLTEVLGRLEKARKAYPQESI